MRPHQALTVALDRVREVLADQATSLIDLTGGVREDLPGGGSAVVSFRCRGFARDYEPVVIEAFMSILRADIQVADIGAHWGLYTLLAAPHVRSVTAFEPSGRNARLLQRNVSLSRLHNVSIVEAAVSDTDGQITFHAYDGRTWGQSMMGGLVSQPFTVPQSVPGVSLDSAGISAGLLKIDVEGAELRVLSGAFRLLAERRPVILVEVHPAEMRVLGDSEGALHTLLSSHRYDVHVLTRSSADSPSAVSHWLCTPAERASGQHSVPRARTD